MPSLATKFFTSSDPDWAALLHRAPRVRIRRRVWRLVESQEQVATQALVDTLEEQALLEELIETIKPRRSAGSERLHYLLATPFRYPPLLWGSRFGRRHEPGLFYASTEPPTALAEGAFYRLLFWQGMQTPPPSARLRSQHTLFAAAVDSSAALRLHETPFEKYAALLTHPQRYDATQSLGALMRAAGIEAFEYRSARAPSPALNAALFVPKALSGTAPTAQQAWLCETRADAVVFSGEGGALRFELADFLVEDKLPQPA